MRRITLWMLSTVAALVLMFSYRTSTNSPAPVAAAAVATGTSSGGTSSDGSSSSGTSSGGASSDGAGGTTYTGSTASTRWGDVQVAITVADGKITAVTVPVYPTENHRDQEINARAVPTLVQETLDAQSAKIDTVSGATVTSDGYLESLQSALDAAHLS
ncbi:FMN-binding protein [Actinoplanes palleronii]|uniref:FMN-binding protein n=1 Tax=Actinoplanes palleronii TaxID=113570 RepID=A0ABQ4BPU2_9ACTN|nr:FMN-binding protein [Actinoplanes palleronii]GIE72697.1 FMN-binding protein [Actinoplanes palleronii]